MSEKDIEKRNVQKSSPASDSVKRGAAKFREKLQRKKSVNIKGSLRNQIQAAVKVNNNNFKDQDQSVKSSDFSNSSHEAKKTQRKIQWVNVTELNKSNEKGKNYPTPRSLRDPKILTEDEIDEVMRRRMVFDSKVGGRSAKGGFKFRKPPRLGSDFSRRRIDRIHSAYDSDDEDERDGAYGYGNVKTRS